MVEKHLSQGGDSGDQKGGDGGGEGQKDKKEKIDPKFVVSPQMIDSAFTLMRSKGFFFHHFLFFFFLISFV